MAVTKEFKGRVRVDGTENGFVSVKLAKGEEPIRLMKEVLMILDGKRE